MKQIIYFHDYESILYVLIIVSKRVLLTLVHISILIIVVVQWYSDVIVHITM